RLRRLDRAEQATAGVDQVAGPDHRPALVLVLAERLAAGGTEAVDRAAVDRTQDALVAEIVAVAPQLRRASRCIGDARQHDRGRCSCGGWGCRWAAGRRCRR